MAILVGVLVLVAATQVVFLLSLREDLKAVKGEVAGARFLASSAASEARTNGHGLANLGRELDELKHSTAEGFAAAEVKYARKRKARKAGAA